MIPITRPSLPPLDEYVSLLQEVWESRMLSNFSHFATRLEDVAKSYLGAGHVLAVASGDLGLMITIKALNLPPGSPCFVSTFTFNSTINAALWNGLRPVLVDVDTASFNMSPDSVEAAAQRHPGPGVILATHVFGNPCDADALRHVADERSLSLVFDAAHGYGSRRDGVPVGQLGDAEVFSLSGTKLVTSGEGGLVSTRHDWLAERVRYLRAYGFQHDYVSRYVGLNAKISELHSALGVLTLARVEEVVRRRLSIVERYRDRLGDRADWQRVRPVDRSTFKDVAIRLGRHRDAVETALTEAGIQTKRYFLPLHHMSLYAPHADTALTNADELYGTLLCLPAYDDLDDDTVDRICDVILGALAA